VVIQTLLGFALLSEPNREAAKESERSMSYRTGRPQVSARHLRLALGLLAALLLALPTSAWAHPLGNFTVNRYSRLELAAKQVRLRYVVDMAEIPAFQELARIDSDGDGQVGAAEHETYLAAQAARLIGNLHLRVDGAELPLEPEAQSLAFPEGQGGLKTLRLTLDLRAALPATAGPWAAEFRDENFPERLGWQEVVVRGAGATLLESSVAASDQSDELRSYPEDMLQAPLAVSAASFRFAPGGAAGALAQPAQTDPGRGAGERLPDELARLIATPSPTLPTVLLALLAAFGLGAAHALAPGHGKTVVAAYLVGARGTAGHAVFLGLTTTVTHTAGVFALGLVTLLVSEFILPEQLYPWLGVISGVLVFGIGAALFRGRLRALLARASARQPHAHSHDDHQGEAGQPYLHDHGDGRVHSHRPPGAEGAPISWRSLLALGVSGGLLPCPSALVVLLGAIALGRVGFGLLLIVAFSLGLASVLTAIGALLVYARRLFDRIPTSSVSIGGRALRALPILSALLIAIVGIGITVQALLQTGVFRS
jgi:nickel/cobalt transporter (NicO) family protein